MAGGPFLRSLSVWFYGGTLGSVREEAWESGLWGPGFEVVLSQTHHGRYDLFFHDPVAVVFGATYTFSIYNTNIGSCDEWLPDVCPVPVTGVWKTPSFEVTKQRCLCRRLYDVWPGRADSDRDIRFEATFTPEPSTWLMLATGLLGLGFVCRCLRHRRGRHGSVSRDASRSAPHAPDPSSAGTTPLGFAVAPDGGGADSSSEDTPTDVDRPADDPSTPGPDVGPRRAGALRVATTRTSPTPPSASLPCLPPPPLPPARYPPPSVQISRLPFLFTFLPPLLSFFSFCTASASASGRSRTRRDHRQDDLLGAGFSLGCGSQPSAVLPHLSPTLTTPRGYRILRFDDRPLTRPRLGRGPCRARHNRPWLTSSGDRWAAVDEVQPLSCRGRREFLCGAAEQTQRPI